MILITKNETKKVFLTLNPTIDPVYYLFQFTSNDTGNQTYMMSEDNSPDPDSFNSFTFSEGSTYSTAGGFTLNPGTYDYKIYETPYQDNLNPASASGFIEVGLMEVIDDEDEGGYQPGGDDYIYYDQDQGISIPVQPSNYGVFYSKQDQPITTINTPQKVLLTETDLYRGITIDSSKIIIERVGVYRMSLTFLIKNTSNSPQDVVFWLRFNGVDYPNSAHYATIQERKSASEPREVIIHFDFIGKSLNVNDYVEVYWEATSTNISLDTTTNGNRPDSASVLVNINQI